MAITRAARERLRLEEERRGGIDGVRVSIAHSGPGEDLPYALSVPCTDPSPHEGPSSRRRVYKGRALWRCLTCQRTYTADEVRAAQRAVDEEREARWRQL